MCSCRQAVPKDHCTWRCATGVVSIRSARRPMRVKLLRGGNGVKSIGKRGVPRRSQPKKVQAGNAQRGLNAAEAEPAVSQAAPPTKKSAARIGAAEALSFLKETKGKVSWPAKEMAE